MTTFRKKRVLKKASGSIEKPRLSVFCSNKHIYAQLIDDNSGHTLVASSTLDKKIILDSKLSSTEKGAFIVGQDIAKKAEFKGIQQAIFDRGVHPYQGRVKSLAEGARNQKLKI
jgi:large subunit ribosomal protein L18